MNSTDPSSVRKQHDETTFIDIVTLYIRKRRLFFGIFISLTIVLLGGSIARAALSTNGKAPEYKAIGKAILIDPYFAEAGEFCVGVATSDVAIASVADKMGSEIAAGYRKTATASYDDKRKIFSLTVMGRDEAEARALVMAGMEAVRNIHRETGTERYAAIAARLEDEASRLVPDALNIKEIPIAGQDNALYHFIEGYAQAKANRIELEALTSKLNGSQAVFESSKTSIEQKVPEDLLISDLIGARSIERDRKNRLDTFVAGTTIPAQEAVLAADTHAAQILFSRIGVLREIRPTILVKFEVIDLVVTRLRQRILSTANALALIAAFFIAAFAVLAAGYVERVKANPEAMRLIRESCARPSRKGGK